MIWFPRAAVETANVAWWAIEFARLGRLPDERDDANGMLPVLQQLDLAKQQHLRLKLWKRLSLLIRWKWN